VTPRTDAVRRWAPVALVAVAIAAASLAPGGDGVGLLAGTLGPVGIDKLVHFLAYLALGTTAVLALVDRRPGLLAVLGLATAAYGIGIELAQVGVVGRTVEVGDAVANVAGATAVPGSSAVATLVRGRPRPDRS